MGGGGLWGFKSAQRGGRAVNLRGWRGVGQRANCLERIGGRGGVSEFFQSPPPHDFKWNSPSSENSVIGLVLFYPACYHWKAEFNMVTLACDLRPFTLTHVTIDLDPRDLRPLSHMSNTCTLCKVQGNHVFDMVTLTFDI